MCHFHCGEGCGEGLFKRTFIYKFDSCEIVGVCHWIRESDLVNTYDVMKRIKMLTIHPIKILLCWPTVYMCTIQALSATTMCVFAGGINAATTSLIVDILQNYDIVSPSSSSSSSSAEGTGWFTKTLDKI